MGLATRNRIKLRFKATSHTALEPQKAQNTKKVSEYFRCTGHGSSLFQPRGGRLCWPFHRNGGLLFLGVLTLTRLDEDNLTEVIYIYTYISIIDSHL